MLIFLMTVRTGVADGASFLTTNHSCMVDAVSDKYEKVGDMIYVGENTATKDLKITRETCRYRVSICQIEGGSKLLPPS